MWVSLQVLQIKEWPLGRKGTQEVGWKNWSRQEDGRDTGVAGGGATEGDKNTLYTCLKFSSNKNVEPEPHVAIRVYNPALGKLREENFELDISPDFTVRLYPKEGKKIHHNFQLHSYLQKYETCRDSMSCLTVGQHKAATIGSTILLSYNRKHRLVFDQPNKQNPGL